MRAMLCVVMLTACGTGGAGDAGPVAAVDAGQSDAGPSGAGTADAGPVECNDLVNDGAEVIDVITDEPAPAMTGGVVTDGTYVLTGSVFYGVAAGAVARRGMLRVRDAVLDIAFANPDGSVARTSSTARFDGTRIELNMTCPGDVAYGIEYASTGVQVVFSQPAPPGAWVTTYTRR